MKRSIPEILYEDNDIVVLNKPSGMLSIPDRYKHEALNVKKWLEERHGEVFVVHRLDKETSGVVVFALGSDAHRNLSLQFENHEVEKKYLAILSGVMREDDLDVDIPLMNDPKTPAKMMPSARGKKSLTHIHVVERFRVATLAECTLHTGRQHQIRVHCSAIGYPLLVDSLYGRSDKFMLSNLKRKYNLQKESEEKPIISRTTLHASILGFKHPSTNEQMMFKCEPPKDFRALLSVLRKYSALYADVATTVFS